MVLDYLGDGNRVTMFKCDWFDITCGLRVDRSGIIQINSRSRLSTNEPFVLAIQASQIFYAKAVTKKDADWYTVIKVKARSCYDLPGGEGDDDDDNEDENGSTDADELYQEVEIPVVARNDILASLDSVAFHVVGEPGEEVELDKGKMFDLPIVEKDEEKEDLHAQSMIQHHHLRHHLVLMKMPQFQKIQSHH